MLGRIVCPASRLGELPDVGRGVSVVLDAVLPDDPRIEAVETHLDARAVALDARVFSWRDPDASAADVARIRRTLFHSIGSCSFVEPVDELQALGMLPA